MNKQTNPVITTHEAFHLLEMLGADPYQLGATYNGKESTWPNEVLHLAIFKRYQDFTYYYEFQIQLTKSGFDEIVNLISYKTEVPITKRTFSEEYYKFSIEPSPLLEIMSLELKESQK